MFLYIFIFSLNFVIYQELPNNYCLVIDYSLDFTTYPRYITSIIMPGNHEALANVGKIIPLHAITNPHTKSLNEIELRLDTPRSIEGAREVKIYQQALCPSCPLYKYNTCTGIRFSIHSSYDLDSDKDRHLQNLKLNLRIFIIK